MTSHYIKKDVDKMIIGTNSLDRFCVDNNGNVGIGTTNPSSKLEVNGNIYPTTDNSFDLGTTTKQFKNVYIENSLINNGTIYTSNGNSLLIDGYNAASGDVVLLYENSVSNVSQVNITNVFTTDYSCFKIIIDNLYFASATDLACRLSNNNGSSWFSTSNYEFKRWYDATTNESYLTGFTQIYITTNAIITGTIKSTVEIWVFGMNDTSVHTQIMSKTTSVYSNEIRICWQSGFRNITPTADNAIQLYGLSQNIYGTFRVYGYK